METISIVASKGGVAKTTTAVNVASVLAQNHKVLIVDMDPQCNTSMVFLKGAQSKNNIYDVLSGNKSAEQCLHKVNNLLSIFAGSEMMAASNFLKPLSLKKLLSNLGNSFDYVVIDTPPTLSLLTINAICTASKIIVPVQIDVFSLSSIVNLHNNITRLKQAGLTDVTDIGVLITRLLPRTIMARDYTEIIKNTCSKLGMHLYATAIREALAVREASAKFLPVVEYAKNSKATEDYISLIQEAFAHGN